MFLTCTISGESFEVSEEESELYTKLGVPLPTLSPDERIRRILARRNERVLYKRTCSGTGRPIISVHHEKAPFPVYAQDYWWSDKWDQWAFGRDYDPGKSFFQQFNELYSVTPQIALNSPNCENSDWTNQCGFLKDCYMTFCCGNSERCMFGMWNSNSENCLDCGATFYSKWCYELFNCNNCFQCRNSDNLESCSDCLFCRDMISCTDCIGCVGLQHKRFHFFNEALSEAEFRTRKAALALHSRSGVNAAKELFDKFQLNFPRRFTNGLMMENSTGDYLIRTENVHNTYNFRESKNLWNSRDGLKCYNSLCLLETWTQDHCIEIEGSLGNTNCGFCNKLWESGNIWYSSHIYNSKDIFGCVSLRHAEYAILNKRYSKDNYFALRERIVSDMKRRGEWGENFPISHSPFAYNLSMGNEYFPMSEEEARKRGYRWETRIDPPVGSTHIWSVPNSIHEVNDETALSEVIRCAESGRHFKLQRQELAFYRAQEIPIPLFHHDVRYFSRMNSRRMPRKLHLRTCSICGVDLTTTYPPSSPFHIACEDCFSKHRDEKIGDNL